MDKVLKGIVAIIFILAFVGFGMVIKAEENTPAMVSAVSFMVNVAYFLLILVVAVTIALSLLSLIKNPSALKKTIAGLVILAVILGVSYVLAGNGKVLGSDGHTLLEAGNVSKWSEAGLNFSLALLLIGGVFFVLDLLKGLVKS
ncbi:MAG: hypothetical protein KGV59_03330 [Tenacibaculum sp.]|nr:hypothetical protein [Tenacibaculum sp.]